MSKQQHMFIALQAENRNLRAKLQILEDRNTQADLIEKCLSAALSGFCSQPFATEPENAQKVAKLSKEIAEATMHLVIKEAREAEKKETEERIAAEKAGREASEGQEGASLVDTEDDGKSRILSPDFNDNFPSQESKLIL